jgi:hypothetical protein
VILLAMFGVMLVLVVPAYAEGNSGSGASIIGTWAVSVTPPTGTNLYPSSYLVTYTAGGTSVTSPYTAYGPSSIGPGAWEQVGNSKTFATTQANVYSIYINTFGSSLWISSIVVNGDTFTGQAKLLVCKANYVVPQSGSPLASEPFTECTSTQAGYWTISGKRVSVTRLQ